MSDVNVNTGSGGTGGVYQPTGTDQTSFNPDMQHALEQLDSIQPFYTYTSTNVTLQAHLPFLSPPKQTQKSTTEKTATEKSTTEHQADLDQILASLPEYQEVMDGMYKPSSKQINDFARNFTAQRGGVPTKNTVEESLAQFVQEQSNVKQFNPASANSIYNSIRLKQIGNSNPEVQVLTTFLAAQYKKQGLSDKDAQDQANADALNVIDSELQDNEVKTPTFNGGPLVRNGITKFLAAQFKGVSQSGAEELAHGLMSMGNLSNMIATFASNISNVDPTTAATYTDPKTIGTLQQALDSSQEVVTESLTLANPSSTDGSMSETDYLKAISDIITTIKQLLTDMQITDSQKSQDLSQSQIQLAEGRYKAQMDKIRKQMKAMHKQSKMSKIMKIVMPIAGALMMVAAILAAPVTGGVATAVLIAVAVSMFVTMTALSETGEMQKGMTALSKGLEKMAGPHAAQWQKDLAVIGTYLAIIAIAVVIMVATSGTAGGVVANMVCMQVACTVLSSTDMMQRSVKDTAKAVDKNASEEDIAIATAVVTTVLVIALSAVSFKCAANAPKGDDAPQKLAQVMDKLRMLTVPLQVAGAATGAGLATYQGITELQMKKLIEDMGKDDQEVAMYNVVIKMLQDLVKSLNEATQGLQDQSTDLTTLFNNTVSGLSADATNVTNSQHAA